MRTLARIVHLHPLFTQIAHLFVHFGHGRIGSVPTSEDIGRSFHGIGTCIERTSVRTRFGEELT